MKLIIVTHYQVQMTRWHFEGRGFSGQGHRQLFQQRHTSWRDPIISALKELHWLLVPYRIQFKLVLLMFKAHVGQCPLYTRDAELLSVPSVLWRHITTLFHEREQSSGREQSVLLDRLFWTVSQSPWGSADSISSFKRHLHFNCV